jgi:putative transcriptional regulator
MAEHIGNYVHELRAQKRVTQEELAVSVGVTRQTIIAIERGNYTPSVLLSLKLAQFFKTPVEKLFYITSKK